MCVFVICDRTEPLIWTIEESQHVLHQLNSHVSFFFLRQDAAEGNHEKLLLKLATKGVVKLFNVIQTQQKTRIEQKGRADAGLSLSLSTCLVFLRISLHFPLPIFILLQCILIYFCCCRFSHSQPHVHSSS